MGPIPTDIQEIGRKRKPACCRGTKKATQPIPSVAWQKGDKFAQKSPRDFRLVKFSRQPGDVSITIAKEIKGPRYTTVYPTRKDIVGEAPREAVDIIEGFLSTLRLVRFRARGATGTSNTL